MNKTYAIQYSNLYVNFERASSWFALKTSIQLDYIHVFLLVHIWLTILKETYFIHMLIRNENDWAQKGKLYFSAKENEKLEEFN